MNAYELNRITSALEKIKDNLSIMYPNNTKDLSFKNSMYNEVEDIENTLKLVKSHNAETKITFDRIANEIRLTDTGYVKCELNGEETECDVCGTSSKELYTHLDPETNEADEWVCPQCAFKKLRDDAINNNLCQMDYEKERREEENTSIRNDTIHECREILGNHILFNKCPFDGDCGRCFLCDNTGGCITPSQVDIHKLVNSSCKSERERVLSIIKTELKMNGCQSDVCCRDHVLELIETIIKQGELQ